MFCLFFRHSRFNTYDFIPLNESKLFPWVLNTLQASIPFCVLDQIFLPNMQVTLRNASAYPNFTDIFLELQQLSESSFGFSPDTSTISCRPSHEKLNDSVVGALCTTLHLPSKPSANTLFTMLLRLGALHLDTKTDVVKQMILCFAMFMSSPRPPKNVVNN